MYILDTKGEPTFAMKTFNNLCIVTGLDTVSEPEEQEHILGKDKTPKKTRRSRRLHRLRGEDQSSRRVLNIQR